jgi:hypothetical protein
MPEAIILLRQIEDLLLTSHEVSLAAIARELIEEKEQEMRDTSRHRAAHAVARGSLAVLLAVAGA